MSQLIKDNAINNKNEDELGFGTIVKNISKAIINYECDKNEGAFTFAIEGEWGSGKTSLVNLIKEELEGKDNTPVIVHFNPWIVTNFEQLINYFFSELLKELLHHHKWWQGLKKEAMKKDFKKFLSIISPDQIELGTTVSGKAIYNLKDTLLSEEEEETIYELKSRISSYLRNLNKNILIIIDDIDRLTDKETETFFRLIKGIADFDNIIYLLLYDKKVVSKSLEVYKHENGEKFLDKIVQYSISLPKPCDIKLNEILFKECDKILEKVGERNYDEYNKYQLIQLLPKYIKNIRDIKRIIATVSFEYPMIYQDVDFVDFFIITLIKVQKHELYELIKNNSSYMFELNKTDGFRDVSQNDRINDFNFEKRLKTDFSKYKILLNILFPESRYNESYEKKHIWKPYFFDNYFSFAVSDARLSTQDYINLELALFKNSFEEFKVSILKRKEKSSYFFDILDDKKNMNLTKKKSINMIINLLKIYHFLRDDKDSYFSQRCIYLSSNYISESKIRKKILKKISNDSDINFLSKTMLIRDIDNKKIIHESKEVEMFRKKLISKLKNITLNYIIDLSYESDFTEYHVTTLINDYNYFKLDISKLKGEIENFTYNSRKNFFIILNIFKTNLYYTSSNEGYISNNVIIKDFFSKVLEIEKIEKYIKNLKDLEANEKELIEIWKRQDNPY